MARWYRRGLLTLGVWVGVAVASGGESLRVLTYNIHHGRGTDGRVDLDRIATNIKKTSPHLVALQEVDRGTERTDRVDQPAELAERTGLTAIFEKNIDFQGGEYGNAVLTSLEVVNHKNVHLPSLTQGEQRGVLVVRCKLPSGAGTVRFLATHFDYRRDDAERLESVAAVRRLVADEETPVLLAGDLNALPSSRVLKSLAQDWEFPAAQPAFTFPAAEPTRQIDYILLGPRGRWEATAVKVIPAAVASDHRPLLVELRLPRAK